MNAKQITEREEREEKAKAILAIKYGQVKEGSLAYWHYKTLLNEREGE